MRTIDKADLTRRPVHLIDVSRCTAKSAMIRLAGL
jgi:hypothetical protein